MKNALKIIIPILFLLIAASAHAYNITWSKTAGPYAGPLTALAKPSQEAKANIIFAISSAGVYKSADYAATWEKVFSEFEPASIVINPADPNKIYVGGSQKIRYSSQEGGSGTWGVIPGSTPEVIGPALVVALAVDPKNPSKVYAEGGIGLTVNKKVYVIDTSFPVCTWEETAPFPTEESIQDIMTIAIKPDNSYIFAGVRYPSPINALMYRSTDEGKSWQPTSQTNIGGQFIQQIIPFATRVYCNAGSLLLSSTNEGLYWDRVNIAPFSALTYQPGQRGSVGIKPNDPNVIYATLDYQVRVSFDGGASWRSAYAGLPESSMYPVVSIAVSPSNSLEAYAATLGDGIYKTTNGGQLWWKVSSGFMNEKVADMSVNPGNYVFAGTEQQGTGTPASGLWRSGNKGVSWEKLTNGLLSARDLRNVEADSRNSGHVYAGGFGYGMFKSTDNGNYWGSINQGLTNLSVTDIAIDYPTSTETWVYASTKGEGVFRGMADPIGGVTSWTQLTTDNLNNTNVLCLAFGGTGEGHFLYAGTENGGVFKFNLSGGTWEIMPAVASSANVNAIAVDPANPKNVYAGGTRQTGTDPVAGVWVSTTEGSVWIKRFTGEVYSLFIDSRTTPSTIYSGADTIRRSTDEGKSWQTDTGYSSSQLGGTILSLARDELDLTFYAAPQFREIVKGIPVIQTPDPPSNLRGSAESSSSIRWSWDNVAGELGFRLKENVSNLIKATLGENVLSYVEGGLIPNTLYARKVTAFGTVESAASSVSSEYTLANPPLLLRVTGIGGTYETLNWDTNSNPAGTKYVVKLSTFETGPFEDYISFEANPSQNVYGLIPKTDYWFKVYAINHNGITTEASNTASAETMHETLGPRIYNIRFDGIPLMDNDVIRSNPLITADVTDEATSPEAFSPVSKEATSLNFSAYYVIFGTELNSFNFSTAEGAYKLSHKLSVPLGPGTYTFYVTARDELGNVGTSAPKRVRVMSGGVATVGPVLTMPTPFKPATEGGNVTIAYTLSTDGPVDIYMYDIGGKIVLRKKFGSGTNGGRTGYNEVKWNGTSDFGKIVGNGIYVYKIVSNGKVIGKGKVVVYD